MVHGRDIDELKRCRRRNPSQGLSPPDRHIHLACVRLPSGGRQAPNSATSWRFAYSNDARHAFWLGDADDRREDVRTEELDRRCSVMFISMTSWRCVQGMSHCIIGGSPALWLSWGDGIFSTNDFKTWITQSRPPWLAARILGTQLDAKQPARNALCPL